MKTLSPETKRARQDHDIFLIMLHAAITWPTKWDASAILGEYFALAFPDQEIREEDFNEELVDRIRRQLLINAGFHNPILENTRRTDQIKSAIVF